MNAYPSRDRTGAKPKPASNRRAGRNRLGSSALELVLTTAVVLPLSMVAYFLGIKMLQFVFAIDSTLLLSPI